ncbi:MAG TPA: GGDEF domain-containing protein [Oxalicibacterium sp.]|nr:GGDEF domain-containing protein [Oxalicibacterium sp.]
MLQQALRFDTSGYALADLQLFAEVNDPGVAAIVAPCQIMHVATDEVIRHHPDEQMRVYIVLSGALCARSGDTDEHPRGMQEMRLLPGESIGELSVLDNAPHFNTLLALQDSALLVIEADTLWRLINESNGVARNLLRQLSFRLRATSAQLRKREKLGEFYRQLSMVDGLTGLHNRAWLNDRLPEMVAEAHLQARPLSVIMIDLDHFKRFNDTHGHTGGDHALRAAAHVLVAALRPSDFAVRYGGEEMIVMLPGTDEAACMLVAQRLCERMREAVVFADMRIPLPQLTASFGIASLQTHQDAEALLAHADAALYRAKNAGRDQVAC